MECPACGLVAELLTLACWHQLCESCLKELSDCGPCPLNKLCNGVSLLRTIESSDGTSRVETIEEALAYKRSKLDLIATQEASLKTIFYTVRISEEYCRATYAFPSFESAELVSDRDTLKAEKIASKEALAFKKKALECDIETLLDYVERGLPPKSGCLAPLPNKRVDTSFGELHKKRLSHDFSKYLRDKSKNEHTLLMLKYNKLELYSTDRPDVKLVTLEDDDLVVLRLPDQPFKNGNPAWVRNKAGRWQAISVEHETLGQKLVVDLPSDIYRIEPFKDQKAIVSCIELLPGIKFHRIIRDRNCEGNGSCYSVNIHDMFYT